MKSKYILSSLLGTLLVLLTLSGTASQVMAATNQFGSEMTTQSEPYFIEDLTVVAGIDSAALIKMNLVGGPSTEKPTGTALDKVKNWIFVLSDQEAYDSYLLRRPFKAPDNATLLLQMQTSADVQDAMAVAELYSDYYGIDLWLGAIYDPNIYAFNGGLEGNSKFNDLVTEIQGDITDGFASALSATDIADAPVKTVFVGEGETPYGIQSVRGIYYVDDEAITGTSPYTLSAANIFGGALTASTMEGYKHYSSVKVRFPYTINPSVITPDTDNVAPQITGRMDWDMQYPGWVKRATLDFEVTYTVDHSALLAPRVSVNMAYDHDLLQTEGILQMEYDIINTGTEVAKNVLISYPLGPDFMDLIENKPVLPRLRDDVNISDTIQTNTSVTIYVDYGGAFEGYDDMELTQEVLLFDNWYQYENGTWVDFDETNTEEIVKTESATYDVSGQIGTIDTTISVSNPDGLSNILVNRVKEFLDPIDINNYSYTEVSELLSDYKASLIDGVKNAAKDLFDLLYVNQTLFDPNYQDFDLVNRTVTRFGENRTEWFLETEIATLDVGASTTVQWALENITAPWMTFGAMFWSLVDIPDGDFGKAIELVTNEHNFYEMMQMLLGYADKAGQLAYGRPISFYDAWQDIWISVGARFSYEDTAGFEYFGFSNGINFQLVDDEAVLNVYVELDKLEYTVGDPVQITGYIENVGDIDAHEVDLWLVHGRLGNNWQIVEPEIFYVETVGIIENGTKHEFNVTVDANSFLGIHPVYAVVDFISDYGQPPLEVENFFNPDAPPAVYEGAGETHQWVVSNMAWGLLLPDSEALAPAWPQPVLDITTTVEFDFEDGKPSELTVTVTIENVGGTETDILALQYFNEDELELRWVTTTEGTVSNGSYGGFAVITVEDINLDVNESVEISMHWVFLTNDGCNLPGMVVVYSTAFENELGGGDPTLGGGTSSLMVMNGEAQETDNWEDYGSSTSTGTSAGADVHTGGQERTRFLGSMDFVYITITTLVITAVVTLNKKRKK